MVIHGRRGQRSLVGDVRIFGDKSSLADNGAKTMKVTVKAREVVSNKALVKHVQPTY
jgi:hypothetical protein